VKQAGADGLARVRRNNRAAAILVMQEARPAAVKAELKHKLFVRAKGHPSPQPPWLHHPNRQ
jgi:hypothetical protein